LIRKTHRRETFFTFCGLQTASFAFAAGSNKSAAADRDTIVLSTLFISNVTAMVPYGARLGKRPLHKPGQLAKMILRGGDDADGFHFGERTNLAAALTVQRNPTG